MGRCRRLCQEHLSFYLGWRPRIHFNDFLHLVQYGELSQRFPKPTHSLPLHPTYSDCIRKRPRLARGV